MEHELQISEEALDDLREMLQDEFEDKWEGIWSDTDQIVALINDANRLAAEDSKNIEKATNALLGIYGVNPSDVREAYSAPTGSYASIGSSSGMSGGITSGLSGAFGGFGSGLTSIGSFDLSSITGIKNGYLVNSGGIGTSIPVTITGTNTSGFDISSLLGGSMGMPSMSMPNLSGTNGLTINQSYDALIHIDGSADAATVADIKNMTPEILQKSYEYVSSKMYKGYVKSGGRVTV